MAFFSLPKYMGWFGKLPSGGDFAARGIPRPLLETIHQWISSGMTKAASLWPEDWQAAYLVSPVWHFAINAGTWDTDALTGCIAPSVDKIGRYSPLIMLRSFDRRDIKMMLPPRNQWLYETDRLLRRVIGERLGADEILSQLASQPGVGEDIAVGQESAAEILGDLGIVDGTRDSFSDAGGWFSWPDLPALFLDRKDRSFWWAEPSHKSAPRQIIHSGPPDDRLFCLLMDGGVLHE